MYLHPTTLTLALLPLSAVQATNIVISNDDGWAEINIRDFYSSLTAAGYNALISAPATDQSGRGSLDAPPTPVGPDGCEFGSCPPGSPAYGRNETMVRFNYVNSFPVTAMEYGVHSLTPTLLNATLPDLAVAGPNVGSNLGIVTQLSGTVGAATAAAKDGIPALAFSGTSGNQTAWNTTSPEPYQNMYADLSTKLTSALVGSGAPYLPEGIWLNVNFPAVDGEMCGSVEDFTYVLSRIYPRVAGLTPKDTETGCTYGDELPDEQTVVGTAGGCFVSVSVGVAETKLDAGAEAQKVVLEKLGGILGCLP